jgi:hypothetical protein
MELGKKTCSVKQGSPLCEEMDYGIRLLVLGVYGNFSSQISDRQAQNKKRPQNK